MLVVIVMLISNENFLKVVYRPLANNQFGALFLKGNFIQRLDCTACGIVHSAERIESQCKFLEDYLCDIGTRAD